MGFLLSFMLLIVFILLFVVLAVFGFIRSLFSFGRQRKQNTDNYDSDRDNRRKKSKVFDDSEGEYTDYEEIK